VDQDELLSMQETANRLGVSMPTLYAIVDKRKELTAIEQVIGRQRRRFFRCSEVEALKQRRAGQTV
jgi:excisionase family DNA binding protein